MTQTRQSASVSGLSCPARSYAQLGHMSLQARWAGAEPGLENGLDPLKYSSPDGVESSATSAHNLLQYAQQVQEDGILNFHETAMDM